MAEEESQARQKKYEKKNAMAEREAAIAQWISSSARIIQKLIADELGLILIDIRHQFSTVQ